MCSNMGWLEYRWAVLVVLMEFYCLNFSQGESENGHLVEMGCARRQLQEQSQGHCEA